MVFQLQIWLTQGKIRQMSTFRQLNNPICLQIDWTCIYCISSCRRVMVVSEVADGGPCAAKATRLAVCAELGDFSVRTLEIQQPRPVIHIQTSQWPVSCDRMPTDMLMKC